MTHQLVTYIERIKRFHRITAMSHVYSDGKHLKSQCGEKFTPREHTSCWTQRKTCPFCQWEMSMYAWTPIINKIIMIIKNYGNSNTSKKVRKVLKLRDVVFTESTGILNHLKALIVLPASVIRIKLNQTTVKRTPCCRLLDRVVNTRKLLTT